MTAWGSLITPKGKNVTSELEQYVRDAKNGGSTFFKLNTETNSLRLKVANNNRNVYEYICAIESVWTNKNWLIFSEDFQAQRTSNYGSQFFKVFRISLSDNILGCTFWSTQPDFDKTFVQASVWPSFVQAIIFGRTLSKCVLNNFNGEKNWNAILFLRNFFNGRNRLPHDSNN